MSLLLPSGHYAENGSEYVFDSCPRCGAERKFYWNEEAERGYCFSGSCGLRVRGEVALIKILRGAGWDYLLPPLPALTQKVTAPVWAAQDLVPILEDPVGRLYLTKKDLDPAIATDCGMLVSPSKNQVYAPLYATSKDLPQSYMTRSVFDGAANPWIFRGPEERKDDKGFKSYYFFAHPSFCNSPYKRSWIILVEGVGDLLRQPVVVENGLAVCGATINPMVGKWVSERAEGVIVWGDNDAAGDEFYVRAKAVFRDGWRMKCRRFRTKAKDPGASPPIHKLSEMGLTSP